MGYIHEPVSDLGHSGIEDPVVLVWYITVQQYSPSGSLTWQKQGAEEFIQKMKRVWIVNTRFFSLCSYVLQELVETERDYVRDLGCVVEVCFQRFNNLYQPQELSRELSNYICQFNTDTFSKALKTFWHALPKRKPSFKKWNLANCLHLYSLLNTSFSHSASLT